MINIDWHYPWILGHDYKSTYKSLWLGWWLICWRMDEWDDQLEIWICFQPGL